MPNLLFSCGSHAPSYFANDRVVGASQHSLIARKGRPLRAIVRRGFQNVVDARRPAQQRAERENIGSTTSASQPVVAAFTSRSKRNRVSPANRANLAFIRLPFAVQIIHRFQHHTIVCRPGHNLPCARKDRFELRRVRTPIAGERSRRNSWVIKAPCDDVASVSRLLKLLYCDNILKERVPTQVLFPFMLSTAIYFYEPRRPTRIPAENIPLIGRLPDHTNCFDARWGGRADTFDPIVCSRWHPL